MSREFTREAVMKFPATLERSKKWEAENKIGHSISTSSPVPPIGNKRLPLSFFKTPTTFWRVWMGLTDKWPKFSLKTDICISMVPTTKTT